MDRQTFANENTVFTHQQDGTLDEFHHAYDDAIEVVQHELGGTHPLKIDGNTIETENSFSVTGPGDRHQRIGEFATGAADDVDHAVSAAAETFDSWQLTSVADRVGIFRRAANLMRDRKYELAATLTTEAGKNRTEAMADIDEGIDFLRFYSRELDRHDGYRLDTGEPTPGQHCSNRLEPIGVFAVIGPFNFPFAIFAGMTTGAAITGNTVVAKPASATPWIAHKVVDILSKAGLPDGVVNLVTGSGSAVGQPLVEHEDVDGVVFTGSREVGRSIQRTFLEQDKTGPVIAELGGKNPVIVTENADLDKAVSGVTKGAFGFAGQKCSATSRVYIHEDVFETFTRELVSETEALQILPPGREGAFVSPLIDENALKRFRQVCDTAREDGTIRTGGDVVRSDDLPDGRYVQPTVVTEMPHDHELAREEHFLPFVTLHPVSDFDEAITKANDSQYGLCAGLFSEDEAEIDEWFERIESGMCYVNRHQSATTGALVQAQPFGGWKSSGTTSKFAGGYWYLPQFMREQTRTIVDEVGRQ
jgi:1-pyrroline-5-carboxylate dehydrogenase